MTEREALEACDDVRRRIDRLIARINTIRLQVTGPRGSEQ